MPSAASCSTAADSRSVSTERAFALCCATHRRRVSAVNWGSVPWIVRATQAAGRSLAEVRRRAQEARSLLDRGLDPIEERKAQRSAAKEAEAAKRAEARRGQVTLARVAREYHERVIEPTRTPKHSAQWIASLENNVPQHIWHAPIAEVTAPLLSGRHCRSAQRVPETASRMRQRLEAVFDDAEFRSISRREPRARNSAKNRRTEKGPASRGSLCCSAL